MAALAPRWRVLPCSSALWATMWLLHAFCKSTGPLQPVPPVFESAEPLPVRFFFDARTSSLQAPVRRPSSDTASMFYPGYLGAALPERRKILVDRPRCACLSAGDTVFTNVQTKPWNFSRGQKLGGAVGMQKMRRRALGAMSCGVGRREAFCDASKTRV